MADDWSRRWTPSTGTGGIYEDWSTDDWDFGDTSHYPYLKADWDGNGTATAAELGV